MTTPSAGDIIVKGCGWECGGGGGWHYNVLCRKIPSTILNLEIYKRVGFSRVEAIKKNLFHCLTTKTKQHLHLKRLLFFGDVVHSVR